MNSLGWPVSVASHAGWSGHVRTSWHSSSASNGGSKNNDNANLEHGGSLYNGQSHVLYWADVSSEVAFVVPTHSTVETVASADANYGESNNGKLFPCADEYTLNQNR